MEEHLEDYLGQELTAQALAGELGRRPRVRLSPEVEPWFVLDPSLFEDMDVDGYRPRVTILVEDDSPHSDANGKMWWPLDLDPNTPGHFSPEGGSPDDTDDPRSRAAQAQLAATAQLRVGLRGLGVDDAMLDSLTALAQACATVSDEQAHHNHDSLDSDVTTTECLAEAPALVARGQALLSSIEALNAAAGHLDAVLLSATRQLTGIDAQILLADKGATSPDELTASQRKKWRAYGKRVTRNEMGAAMGWCPGEISDLVAFANLPPAVTAPVNHALVTGESTWRLVRRYQRACSTFTTEDAAAVANGMFGNDPKASVSERLDSAGEFRGGPWRHREFYRALDREVNKIKGRDPESTKKTREDNLAANDTRVLVEDNGTAQIMIGCTATQGAAVADRIEKAARAARKAGDTRPLCQLRAAAGIALLLHGTADLDSLPDDPDLVTVEQSEQLTKILYGLPAAQLNVIVPLNTLIGTTPGGLAPVDAEGNPIPAAFAAASTATGRSVTGGGGSCTCECTCGAEAGESVADPDRTPSGGSRGQDCPEPGQAGQDCPPPRAEPDGEVGVGEVIGKHSVFLTPDEVRTLALTPGSTMYRLLTDP
ncbi:hypothetical protein, partial [Ornithinimicrobium faecis]|uniref:hypothetical protein n=1 Tax=Ornithinimicrobium faecis TaxID=2934158 RepID=UPI0021189DAA